MMGWRGVGKGVGEGMKEWASERERGVVGDG